MSLDDNNCARDVFCNHHQQVTLYLLQLITEILYATSHETNNINNNNKYHLMLVFHDSNGNGSWLCIK